MKNTGWTIPVQIGDEIIFNSFQGRKYLLRQWSKTNSADFAIAERALLSAMDGRGSSEEAREKFVAAVQLH